MTCLAYVDYERVWIYLSMDFEYSEAGEHLGRGWGEAERVARKAVTLAKSASERFDLMTYEFNLGCTLVHRSKCSAAIENLQKAFARIRRYVPNDRKGAAADLVQYAVQLGRVLLESGQAAEAEAHICKCIEEPGPDGRPILHTKWHIRLARAFRAEALLTQGRKEEALPLLESFDSRDFCEEGWAGYYQTLQEGISQYDDHCGRTQIAAFPLLSSMLCTNRDTTLPAAQAAQYFQTASACRERGNLEEAETHLWKAVDAYELAKEKSTSLSTVTNSCPV